MVEIYATLSKFTPKGRTEDSFLCWHNTVSASMGFADVLISHLHSPVRQLSCLGTKKKKPTKQPKLKEPSEFHTENTGRHTGCANTMRTEVMNQFGTGTREPQFRLLNTEQLAIICYNRELGLSSLEHHSCSAFLSSILLTCHHRHRNSLTAPPAESDRATTAHSHPSWLSLWKSKGAFPPGEILRVSANNTMILKFIPVVFPSKKAAYDQCVKSWNRAKE